MKKLLLFLSAIAWIAIPLSAADLTVDLTATGTAQVTSGGVTALFDASAAPTTVGTGVIDSFVRLQKNGSEKGFNTDFNPPPLDAKAGNFTHSIQFNQLGTVNVGGFDYFRFLLDINQNSNNPLISLDSLKLYSASTGDLSDLSGATQKYDLDAATACVAGGSGTCTGTGPDAEILLNYDNNNGSGNGYDMFFYVPTSVFAGVGASEYIYLYSAFGGRGGDYATNDGIEEWARIQSDVPVPEPGYLLGLALAAGAVFARDYRKRRKTA